MTATRLENAMVRCLLGLLALAAALSAGVAHADVIELKTGQRVEGTLTQTTPANVVVEVGGQTITFDREKVRAIYLGSAPAPAASDATSATGALAALQELQSVTKAGVIYRDYQTRVGDMQIKVDRAFSGAVIDAATKSVIKEAASYYVAAGSWWSTNIGTGGGAFMITTDKLPTECVHYQNYVDSQIAKGRKIMKLGSFTRFTDSSVLSVYWACASDKITEAEKLLGK